MARNFAKLYVGIWSDERFKVLTSQAQRLYIYLFGHQRLDNAGTLVWQPQVAVRTASDLTADIIDQAMHELRAHRYIVLDDDTGLLAVRSYVRNDETLKNSKNTTAFVKAWDTLDSELLKSVIAHEVNRIADESPKLTGLTQCEPILNHTLIDPWELPIPE
ncbi:MAG TPA: hypothetical protein VIG71_10720 [Enteractinococcus sp.]